MRIKLSIVFFLFFFFANFTFALITLDLNQYSSGTEIDNQYLNQGVLFSSWTDPFVLMSSHGPYGANHDVWYNDIVSDFFLVDDEDPVFAHHWQPVYQPVIMEFFEPNDLSNFATTNYFYTKILDVDQVTINGIYTTKIEAYDIDNNLLGVIQTSLATEVEPYIHEFSLDYEGMHKIIFYPEQAFFDPGYYSHNGLFDIKYAELDYSSNNNPIPEPLSFYLLGIGFILLLRLKKQRLVDLS